LDCACGTGQDLHLFHSLGCEVYTFSLMPWSACPLRCPISWKNPRSFGR
jgi:hypothetical protein